MTIFEFHPGLILIIGAIIAAVLPGRFRRVVMVAAPLLALLALFNLQHGVFQHYPFINGLNLVVLNVDPLSWVFGLFFCVIALLANIYALHIKNGVESAAGLIYAGSSLGVVFAGDWMTLIFFWELMMVSSVFLVWFRKTPRARAAGIRYLMVHFFGGNFLLAGIFFKVTAGQTEITALTGTNDIAFWLILIGVAVNAAIPPVHAWLTDAYPEGTVTGSIFLCAFTTKVAIYCLLRLFPGTELLIWAGVIMAIYGIVYAILENDIRRLLSYHIVCQLGYMVAAVGMGADLALNGAAAHAYSNIIFKSLLFMCAGAVIYATGRSKLTELGGLFKAMPVVAVLYIIGAFSISGLPLFNGFVSKAMITGAAAAHGFPVVERLLYLASVGTFLSVGLKLFYFMFFGPDKGLKVRKIPLNMTIAMSLSAFLCLLYGLVPSLLYQYLPFSATYQPFTVNNVVSSLQLLIATFAAFWILIPKLKGSASVSLDTDWFYRKPLVASVDFLVSTTARIQKHSVLFGNRLLLAIIPFFFNPLRRLMPNDTKSDPIFPAYGGGTHHFPIGTIVFMVLLMFIAAFIVSVSGIVNQT